MYAELHTCAYIGSRCRGFLGHSIRCLLCCLLLSPCLVTPVTRVFCSHDHQSGQQLRGDGSCPLHVLQGGLTTMGCGDPNMALCSVRWLSLYLQSVPRQDERTWSRSLAKVACSPGPHPVPRITPSFQIRGSLSDRFCPGGNPPRSRPQGTGTELLVRPASLPLCFAN